MKDMIKEWLKTSATVRLEGNNGNSILRIEVPHLQEYLGINRKYGGVDLDTRYRDFVADHAREITEAQGLRYDPRYHINVVIG